MLTDAKLRSLKPAERAYKVADRDGMYVAVSPSGGISFRYNYRINGRQETLVLGVYGADGLTLAGAREKLLTARKQVAEGISPARLKADTIGYRKEQLRFSEWAEQWLEKYRMAESTQAARRFVFEKDLRKPFGALLLHEITEQALRHLCDRIVARGAPAVAVHAREIVMLVFRYAAQRGEKHPNPADGVPPASIATFEPRDRTLTPHEIKQFYHYLERSQCAATIRIAARMLLLTMVRKSELTDATWSEIDFASAVWTIPGVRMKRRNPHNVYLSNQVLDMLIALKTCAGGSRYLLPSRYDPERPMAGATLNMVLRSVVAAAKADGITLTDFSPHDLRRTGSTLLHEAGFNSDWIEKCLAHEQKGVRAVYNKAEYAEQRRNMMQQWADMVDGWVAANE
jgi:integrase